MREKVKRLLELMRAGKLTLEDAAPLLAALNPKLALQGADRELLDALLARDDLSTAQIAEHLLLLRGVKDSPSAPPKPPRVPPPGFDERWNWVGYDNEDRADRTRRSTSKGGLENMVESFAERIENWAEQLGERTEQRVWGVNEQDQRSGSRGQASRILTVRVESSQGDEYTGHFPVSLAPHLHKLIPPHGQKALEQAGFSLETLQLLIGADPPSGDLIHAEDHEGNEVYISIK